MAGRDPSRMQILWHSSGFSAKIRFDISLESSVIFHKQTIHKKYNALLRVYRSLNFSKCRLMKIVSSALRINQ